MINRFVIPFIVLFTLCVAFIGTTAVLDTVAREMGFYEPGIQETNELYQTFQ